MRYNFRGVLRIATLVTCIVMLFFGTVSYLKDNDSSVPWVLISFGLTATSLIGQIFCGKKKAKDH